MRKTTRICSSSIAVVIRRIVILSVFSGTGNTSARERATRLSVCGKSLESDFCATRKTIRTCLRAFAKKTSHDAILQRYHYTMCARIDALPTTLVVEHTQTAMGLECVAGATPITSACVRAQAANGMKQGMSLACTTSERLHCYANNNPSVKKSYCNDDGSCDIKGLRWHWLKFGSKRKGTDECPESPSLWKSILLRIGLARPA